MAGNSESDHGCWMKKEYNKNYIAVPFSAFPPMIFIINFFCLYKS